MKNKLFAGLLIMTLVLSLAGCGKKTAVTTESTGACVEQELTKMVSKDLPGIASDRDKAVEIYNSYFATASVSDASESDAWETKLETEALPSYDKYLSNLDALNYSNQSVQNLKNSYENSAKCQRAAIQYVVNALKTADSTQLDNAVTKMNDSMYYLKQYEDDLKALCDSNGITLNGTLQTATLTDAVLSTLSDATPTSAE